MLAIFLQIRNVNYNTIKTIIRINIKNKSLKGIKLVNIHDLNPNKIKKQQMQTNDLMK